MSIKKIFIPVFLILSAIIGYSTFSKKSETKPTNADNTNFDSNQKLDKASLNPTNLQKLAVIPERCIGCGKCARIDTSHFEMNQQTRKAIVINSGNLSSQNLAMAINNCPTSAITLE
mgnify:CR=1